MKIKTIISLCGLMLGLSGCTKNFEEINTNPNLINEISPGTLLNEIIYNMAANNLTNHYHINCQLMQIQLNYPQFYGGVQRYEILPTTGDSQWNAAYRWAKNVSEMRSVAEKEQSNNYLAIALTLQAWIYSNLTDTFGDVPFFEASKAEEGILQAKYDKQEDIYAQLLEDLALANSLYDTDQTMNYGTDILFANDVQKWQKFTNSLRLRLLLRISDVYEPAYTEMQAIVADPISNPIIGQASESVILHVTGITPNLSPWSRALDFSNQHAVGSFFIETLNELEDPRRPFYVGEAKRGEQTIGYKGIPSGYDPNTSFDYSPSYMNNLQVTAPMIIPILTYAEVEFIQAELAQKGYGEDAASHFKNGIKAAVELWTKRPLDEQYFSNELATYDGTLARIMLHKYLALYFTDNQQWAEYRRTGYPVLPTTGSKLNNNTMPSRLMYASLQSVYNPDNYKAAITEMGGDDVNVKVWWDVK
ncbi:SusD/RagB family nutrient-binding outer membrane lipoprotein [Sphingobacterium haloxyli]|uniref:SusD/RagB family nutrient-binding outer membrane lipoprotein n=1 Tax=Sphingobacterium haloxyli TaxID=2100533 RepID=A0A2S9J5M3_9SPHI|nr:SusD/RagB family nutrient-binding outer membrane lipoprotein [Sphingobacterium haloxyli]PRD48071.1 SusD/RagB family nutrient-binding outer membrane lipoprotein [Sphingobacterium haloxyli]